MILQLRTYDHDYTDTEVSILHFKISQIIVLAFCLVLAYDLLEEKRLDEDINILFCFLVV